MFQPVSPKVDFRTLEFEIQEFWKKNDTFKRSLEIRKDAPRFVVY